MVHWWMQVVETGGAPGDAGLMVTWPLHVPLKSGYVTGAVELLQPAHVTQTKMLIDFQERGVIPVTRFLSIMGSVRKRPCGRGRDSLAAYTADRPSPYTMVMVRLAFCRAAGRRPYVRCLGGLRTFSAMTDHECSQAPQK